MKRTFTGNFKIQIERLIKEKQALGFLYIDNQYILANFDRFCIENYPNETTLTRDIGMHWAELRPSEHSATFSKRITPVRELGRYMQRTGIQAFVIPDGLIGRMNRYVPHFFTHEELSLLFKATDGLKYCHNSPARHLVVPVMFRLIYTCGLRAIEARKLMISDIDLETGTMNIRESKGHKDRIIVVSKDMLALCIIYRKKMVDIFPDSDYFFPNRQGRCILLVFWTKRSSSAGILQICTRTIAHHLAYMISGILKRQIVCTNG
jgi:integrase